MLQKIWFCQKGALSKDKIKKLYSSFTHPFFGTKSAVMLSAGLVALLVTSAALAISNPDLLKKFTGEQSQQSAIVYRGGGTSSNLAAGSNQNSADEGSVLGVSSPLRKPAVQGVAFNESYLRQLILNNLNDFAARGIFRGPQGPQGSAGPQGPAGLASGPTSPPSNPASLISYPAPISYVLPNPAANFSGLSLFAATNISAARFDGGDFYGGNFYGINAAFTGNLNVTGTISGTINLGFTKGSVVFQGDTGLGQDNANFFWDDTNKNLGIGTAIPDGSAIVDLNSTTKGFLAPRMTTIERDAIAVPATGLLVFNTDTNQFNVYNGVTWATISGGSGSSKWSDLLDPTANLGLSMQGFTTGLSYGNATGAGTNLFTLSDTAANTGTGYLFNLNTAAGSTLKPLRVSVNNGTDALTINAAGLVTANNFASSSAAITGGSINSAPVGNTTPSTGIFTTLTGTTVNGLTITNNGGNTLNIAAGKTATLNNSLGFSGTDGTTFTFPGTSDTVVTLGATQTLTGKTIAAGSNTITGITNANLSGSAGITNANLANSSVTVNTTGPLGGGGAVSLGGALTLTCATCTTSGSSLFTLAGSSGSAAVTQGSTATLVQGTNITTTGAAGPQVTIAVVNNPTFSGLVTANLGATISGATTSINASSNFATNINTGTSTGTVTIGNSASTAVKIGNLTTNGPIYTSAGDGTLNSEANLSVARGGTGAGTFTTNGVLFGNGTSALGVTAQGAAGTVLHGNGGVPSFSAIVNGDITNSTIDLTTKVTGILPIANGGTNSATSQGAINNISQLTTNGDLLYNDGTNSTRLARGSNTQCLTSSTTTIVWGSCAATATLQTAYGNGNTITTTDARDIAITLADTTTDSNFTIATAAGSTGSTAFSLTDGSNATPPSQLVLIRNNDTNEPLAAGLKVTSAAGSITTGIDISGSNITNALSIGANAIAGTNFSVTGGGAITGTSLGLGSGIITSGLINGQTVSSAANFTGTVAFATLGSTDSTTILCRNTSNQLAGCNALTDAQISDTLTASNFVGSGSTTNAVDLGTAEVAGTLSVVRGGTGVATFGGTNTLLYTSGADTLSSITAGTNGQLLLGVTAGAPAFATMSNDATITNGGVLTLKNTGTSGTYGSASQVPVFTTDAQGRITAVTNTSIAITGSNCVTCLLTSGGQTVAISGGDGTTGDTFNLTNTASSGTTAANGLVIGLTGTDNAGGANTLNALNFSAVTAHTNNTFNGLSFPAGNNYTNYLKTPTIVINGSGAITGATGISSSGTIAFSGFSSNGGPLYTNGSGVLAQATGGISTQVLHGGAVPSFGAVILGTDTTGNYVSDISGTANQITASSPTGSVTLSIPSDFRAPGTLNAVSGVATGAGAGTQRIDASGNLVNIGTITSGLINGQTISSAANFTGTIALATLGANTGAVAICRNASNQISTCGTNPASVTLQNVYDAASGNTIATTDARDIAFTLADTATDSNFTVTTAAGGAGLSTFALANGSNAAPPAELVLIKNNDTNQALGIGISVQSAAGGVTTAFDASGSNITNALSIGANAIAGTNFGVTSGGAITGTSLNVGAGTITSGLINGQTISSAANFTGTIAFGSLGATDSTTILCRNSSNQLAGCNALTDSQISDTLTASIFHGSGSTTDAVDLATAEVAGTLPVARGGTGVTTFGGTNTLLYTSAADTLSSITAGSNGQLLLGVTSGAPAFSTMSNDATITNAGVLTLKNTGTAGTYGSASQVPVFTTDAQGRVTSATNTAIAITGSNCATCLLTSGGQTVAISGGNGTTGDTFNVTNTASSGTTTANGLVIGLIGTDNAGGANTLDALNFSAVTAHTNNTFNGLNFPASNNYTNYLNTPSIVINGSGAIIGATGVSSSGTITFSGFSTNGGLLYTNGSGVLSQTGAGSATTVLHGGPTPSLLCRSFRHGHYR